MTDDEMKKTGWTQCSKGWWHHPIITEDGPHTLLCLTRRRAEIIQRELNKAREEERELCCRDICDLCHQREPAHHHERKEFWVHEHGDLCDAHWIRARVNSKEKT